MVRAVTAAAWGSINVQSRAPAEAYPVGLRTAVPSAWPRRRAGRGVAPAGLVPATTARVAASRSAITDTHPSVKAW